MSRIIENDSPTYLNNGMKLAEVVDAVNESLTAAWNKFDDLRGLVSKLEDRALKRAVGSFSTLELTGLTADRLVSTDAVKRLESVGALSDWISGTPGQVTVSDDGDGTITLSAPGSHAPVTVGGAPLSLVGQQISFNYDGAHFQLAGANLQIKPAYIRGLFSGTAPITFDNTTGVIGLTQTSITHINSGLAAGLLTTDGAGLLASTANNSANWDTAFGWGNHALAGYLTSVTPHALLSATHNDTAAAAPVLGDLLVGAAGPAWSKLANVAVGSMLFSTGAGSALAWNTTGALSGNLMIGGTGAAASLLEVFSAAAHPIITITGYHDTDYDPQICFRTDTPATTKWSMGVDSTDNWFVLDYANDVSSANPNVSVSNLGRLGLSVRANATRGIYQQFSTTTNATHYHLYFYGTWTPSAGGTADRYTYFADCTLSGSSNVRDLFGTYIRHTITGSGTMANIYGAVINHRPNNTTRTVTGSVYSFYSGATLTGSKVAVTGNTYGIYLADLFAGYTAAAHYGVYQAGVTSINQFDGEIRIRSDSIYQTWGAGRDCGIMYDGTNMQYNSQLVGTGGHQFTGVVGVGAAPSSTTAFRVNINFQTANTRFYGIDNYMTYQPSGASASFGPVGYYGQCSVLTNFAIGTTYGLWQDTYLNGGSGTVAGMYGLLIRLLAVNTTRTINANVYGAFIEGALTGTIVTQTSGALYGLRIGDLSAVISPASNYWSFYQDGSSGLNGFEGEIQIRTDSKYLKMGAGQDFGLTYDGTYGIIDSSLVAPSDIRITCGANKTIELQNVVYADVEFPLVGAKVPAANFPDWTDGAPTANQGCYAFDVNDFLDLGCAEVPHGWAIGTILDMHIHVSTKDANASGADRFVKFQVFVSYATSDTSAWSAWTEVNSTGELTIPNGTGTLKSRYLDLGNVDLTGYTVGTQVKVRIKRIAATGGTEYASHIYVTQVGAHAQLNTIGSRSETAK